ncbi:MAG: SusC/RagA family TonB-linked outer membrane protein [Bacteroidota bacterium]
MRKIFLFLSVLLMFGSTLKAQTRTVSGVVTGDKGETLPGVTVKVKGSITGTQTDIDGKYSIKVTSLQNVVIGVTYIGYAYQEKTLKIGEMNADFQLSSTASNLSEVVVVGYGEQKKATLTGSIATIDMKKIEDLPAISLSATLVGQTPSLSINQDNRPGQGTTINIRNAIQFNGANGSTEPIYIIDDIKRTNADFNLLDPSEVESISILKDAEAAIYGVSGGNGAVLVRTKKGKNSAPKISFSSSFGTANAVQLPKMMSGIQLATFINDYLQETTKFNQTSGVASGNSIDANGYINGVVTNKNAGWYAPDELAYISDPANNTDYLKQVFKPANVIRGALNVSGGGDKATYFISADYVRQGSNFEGVNADKYGVRANVETKPAKGLTVNLSLSEDQSYNRSFWYKTKSTTENLNQDVGSSLSTQPWTQHVINGFPVYLQSNTTFNSDNVYIPLYQASNNFTQSLSFSTNLLGKISYEIPKVNGLVASVTYNQNINNGFPRQYGTSFNYYRFAGTGSNNHIPGGVMNPVPVPITNGDIVTVNPSYTNAYQLDGMLNYHHSFGKHNITATAIYEQIESNKNGVSTQFPNTIPGGLPNGNFTTGTTFASQSNGQVAESGLLSYIGRLNYDYNNTYIAQVIFRRDGSTDFAPGYQYGNFGGVSLGWVASNEKFIKNNFTFIDQLKFRASVGIVGSDNTQAYQYLQQYNPQTGSSGGAVFNEQDRGVGIKSAALNNPTVTWDHQTKTDYGLDASFLKNRLSVTADYYWNHLYDGLGALSSATPFTIGNTPPTENYASVNTFGYELSIGWRDRISNNAGYNITAFYSFYDNKNLIEDISQGLIGTIQDHKGQPDDQGVFGYKSLGIIRTPADAAAIIASRSAAAGGANNVKILGATPQPGMLNFEDLDGNGIISTDDADKEYLSKRSSNHNTVGLNFGFTFKSLSVNVVTGASWGGQGSIPGSDYNGFNGNKDYTANKPVFFADHWSDDNPNAKYPSPAWTSNYTVTSDFWFVNSFTANIQNANISYTLPTKWTKVIGLASARLYGVCTNVLSLYNPYPDHYKVGTGSVYTYPTLRTISIGLNASF